MSTELFIIDPQNDFCDGPANGALAVPGAWADMQRLAGFIAARTAAKTPLNITVSLDAHHKIDIGHPGWWVNAAGANPPPFTLITAADLQAGTWTPVDPANKIWASTYLRRLADGGRHVHTVWPEHCLLGTPGQTVQPDVMGALNAWAGATGQQVNWVLKGLNPRTEHYSAVAAEVQDTNDPHTAQNKDLVNRMVMADTIFVAGEALSHCVKSTIEDLIAAAKKNFSIDLTPRLVFLTDTMSPVPAVPNGPDFPVIGRAFLDKMRAGGARFETAA